MDGSGSVANEDFHGPLKEALKAIIQKFSKAKIAIRQFSDKVRVEAAYTSDITALTDAVSSMFWEFLAWLLIIFTTP